METSIKLRLRCVMPARRLCPAPNRGAFGGAGMGRDGEGFGGAWGAGRCGLSRPECRRCCARCEMLRAAGKEMLLLTFAPSPSSPEGQTLALSVSPQA